MKRFMVIESNTDMHTVFVWNHEGEAVCMSYIERPDRFINAVPLNDCVAESRSTIAQYVLDRLLPFTEAAPENAPTLEKSHWMTEEQFKSARSEANRIRLAEETGEAHE